MGQAFAVGQREQLVCPMSQPNQRKEDIHYKAISSNWIHQLSACTHAIQEIRKVQWNTELKLDLHYRIICYKLRVRVSWITIKMHGEHQVQFVIEMMSNFLLLLLYRLSLSVNSIWAYFWIPNGGPNEPKAIIKWVTNFTNDGCGGMKSVPACWHRVSCGFMVTCWFICKKTITHYMGHYCIYVGILISWCNRTVSSGQCGSWSSMTIWQIQQTLSNQMFYPLWNTYPIASIKSGPVMFLRFILAVCMCVIVWLSTELQFEGGTMVVMVSCNHKCSALQRSPGNMDPFYLLLKMKL